MWAALIWTAALISGLPDASQPAQITPPTVAAHSAGQKPARIDLPANRGILTQRLGGRQAGWSAGFGPGPFGAAMGPPMWGVGFGLGMGSPAQDDAGPVLVDLIQKTIAPGHWAPQGGPGTIYYWRPGRALIIRASQEAHEQIGDLLRQLERAGR
jgi:hypothetical protein